MKIIFNTQPGEEIREIEDFPGYWASNLGRIISAPNHIHKEWVVLKSCLSKSQGGYEHLDLCRDGKRYTKEVHDLVGMAFNEYDDDPNKEWCHRPDATKTNCRADNLVWDTKRKNAWDAQLSNNPDFAQDCYIYEQKETRWNLKGAFHVVLPINGKTKGMGGYHATREEARRVRDRLCAELGIPLPELETLPNQERGKAPVLSMVRGGVN